MRRANVVDKLLDYEAAVFFERVNGADFNRVSRNVV